MTDLVNVDHVNNRKRVRESAAEIVELIEDVAKGWPDQYRQYLWEVLQGECATRLPQVQLSAEVDESPMTDPEAKRFELERVFFGKYNGYTIGGILEEDPKYLDWLAGTDDSFKCQLRRYLKNPKIEALLADL